MYSLYIDTHDAQIVIALFNKHQLITKKLKGSSKNHSDFTMPLIKEILEENNITPKELGEILVINGPGSFTGVRIGVTIAKTLAYTLDIPIKTMSSLEMIAVSSHIEEKKIAIIQDVKGVFLGIYDKDDNLIGEMTYQSNTEFIKYKEETNLPIITATEIDLEGIYAHFKTKDTINAHKANPVYIKVIEALKHD